MKEPKVEAKELVNLYESIVKHSVFGFIFNKHEMACIYASVNVNQILSVLQSIPDIQVAGNILLDKIEHYEQVKQEINKL